MTDLVPGCRLEAMARRKKRACKTKAAMRPRGPVTSEMEGETEDEELNERALRFCDAYVIDPNATKAAKVAGFSAKTAAQQGCRLLKKVQVQDRIRRLIRERRERTKMEGDEVLLGVANIARADILNYMTFGPGGLVLRQSSELTEMQARCIREVTETCDTAGNRKLGFKLHDSLKAYDMLMKHHKLYDEPQVNVNISWADIMSGAKDVEAHAASEADDEQEDGDGGE